MGLLTFDHLAERGTGYVRVRPGPAGYRYTSVLKDFVHRSHGLALHVRQDVRVDVGGGPDAPVSQEIGNQLEMHTLTEQQRGARVPSGRVEGHIRQPRSSE